MAPGERVGRQPDGLSGRESSPESSCGRGLGHGEQPFRRGPGEQGDRREMTVSCAGVQPARDGSNMRVSMSSLRAPCNPPADRHRSRRWAGHPRALAAPPQCPKIRAIPGPSLAQRAPRNPFSLVNSDADRVPPADEESSGVVFAEEAGLLLDAREEAPDLGFHPSGAFHSARSRPSPACTLTPKLPVLPAAVPLPTSASGPVTDQTPGSALGCVTLADALPRSWTARRGGSPALEGRRGTWRSGEREPRCSDRRGGRIRPGPLRSRARTRSRRAGDRKVAWPGEKSARYASGRAPGPVPT